MPPRNAHKPTDPGIPLDTAGQKPPITEEAFAPEGGALFGSETDRLLSDLNKAVAGQLGTDDDATQLKAAIAAQADKYQPGPFPPADDPSFGLSIAQATQVAKQVNELREEFAIELGRIRDQVQSSRVNDLGLLAEMVGTQFNCPKCGLRLNAPSTTAQRGQLYEHPFLAAPQLGGVQCELKGRKFKAPVVFLQFADASKPSPLTGDTK